MVRYKDNEKNEYLPDHVGRCDREQSCGYHYNPKQLIEDNPGLMEGLNDNWRKPDLPTSRPQTKPETIHFIPSSLMEKTCSKYSHNYFVSYLHSLFADDITNDLIQRFKIGTSKRWEGATVFWQVDKLGNIRQAKVMLYNPNTGKRVKEDQPPEQGRNKIFFAGKQILKSQGIAEPNLKQCLFGEHQLPLEPNKSVAIVESEKTAILMSVLLPEYIWLATGGKNGCRWTELSVFKSLEGRNVVLFPDLGCYDDWSEKAELLKRIGFKISVSQFLEDQANQNDKLNGFDLVDYLIKPDAVGGWALTETGYPMFWDSPLQAQKKPVTDAKPKERIRSPEGKILDTMVSKNPLVTQLVECFDLVPEKQIA